VIGRIGRSLGLESNVIGRIGRSLGLESNVIGRIGRSLGLESNVIGRIGRSLGLENKVIGRMVTHTVRTGPKTSSIPSSSLQLVHKTSEFSNSCRRGFIYFQRIPALFSR
jgi:hypothetical protein